MNPTTSVTAFQVVEKFILLKAIREENFMDRLYNTSKGITEEDVDISCFYFLLSLTKNLRNLLFRK